MTIYQLLGCVILCLIVFLILRNINERFSVFVTIAGTLVVLAFVITKLSSVFGFIQHLADCAGVSNDYFKVVLKGLAVCYLGEFTISACKSCAQNAWADAVELACRCTLLVLAIPLFEDFLEVIMRLLK